MQFIHGVLDLLFCDGGDIPVLGKVLTDQSIGIFA